MSLCLTKRFFFRDTRNVMHRTLRRTKLIELSRNYSFAPSSEFSTRLGIHQTHRQFRHAYRICIHIAFRIAAGSPPVPDSLRSLFGEMTEAGSETGCASREWGSYRADGRLEAFIRDPGESPWTPKGLVSVSWEWTQRSHRRNLHEGWTAAASRWQVRRVSISYESTRARNRWGGTRKRFGLANLRDRSRKRITGRSWGR